MYIFSTIWLEEETLPNHSNNLFEKITKVSSSTPVFGCGVISGSGMAMDKILRFQNKDVRVLGE